MKVHILKGDVPETKPGTILGETMSGYDTFSAAAETHALKVVLEAEPLAHAPVPAKEALATDSPRQRLMRR